MCFYVLQSKDRSGGESSRNHTFRPPSDKPKGPFPQAFKFQTSQHQKPSKSGGQSLPSSSGQPPKHSNHPGKHQSSSGHHSQHTGASTHHTPGSLNGAHPQQTSHNSTHDSKARPSLPPGAKPPVKYHPRPTEDPHRQHGKLNSIVKHSTPGQTKHHPPPHHHQAAPNHHANPNKPSDTVNKHRHPPGEHKHRNHDGRIHNSLKRPHSIESREVAKRVKLEMSAGNPPLPPLPAEPNRQLTLPPLPSQRMELPPLPPPLPADPPPDFLLGKDFPPPPPLPN